MPRDIHQIDSQWAWAQYEPSADRPWDRRAAAHLYRRAGFGASLRELDEAVHQSPAEVVEQLASATGPAAAMRADLDQLARTLLATGDSKNLSSWWLYGMLAAPDQLLEKTTLFWHGHFATGAEKVNDMRLMYEQNRLLREHALGDFAALAQAISRDPAMLIYLDSATNRKAHPNENFARELMELFCLGEGAYTEQDVQQVARCFTGWEIRRGKFRFNRYQHDAGEKTFLKQAGEFGGEDAVRVVLAQRSAPRFIAAKIVNYFVFDEPWPSAQLIQPLADDFLEHGYDIGRLVKRVLTSNLFFSDLSVGRKIRSPIELGVGMLRSLEGTANTHQLAQQLADLGHALFYPPNVKGWEGGRTWINSSTLLGRANLVQSLMFGENTRFAGGDLESLAARDGAKSPEQIVSWLLELLVAAPVPDEAQARLIALAAEAGDKSRRIAAVVHAMSMLPEFQLG